jgi:hypothetical protein
VLRRYQHFLCQKKTKCFDVFRKHLVYSGTGNADNVEALGLFWHRRC